MAEYQRRGVVHFHAVIRLDGSEGPVTAPPAWATADLMTDAVRHAASAVAVTVPKVPGEPTRVFRWGAQLDVRQITMDGDLSEQAVAAYIAKYATKATECVGRLDRRISLLDDLTALPIRDHPRRLITECMRLGVLDELTEFRLVQWAHMLGFRGHFSAKSQRYSTTLGDLRADRADHMRDEAVSTGRLLLFEEDTVLITSHWDYAGQGLSAGERLLAAALTGTALPAFPTSGVGAS